MELSAPSGKDWEMALPRTDAEVIEASLGEPACFAEIFDRHFAAVFRFAERRVGHGNQAALAASRRDARARLEVVDRRERSAPGETAPKVQRRPEISRPE